MLDTNKTDERLGILVNDHLTAIGINTPTTERIHEEGHRKIERIQEHYKSILQILGMDLNDDSLQETPNRCAKMMVKELNWGLLPENFPKCTTVNNKMHYDEMVIEKCSVNSTCEHHLVYFGSLHNRDLGCWVAYIPNEKVLGLSKLSRIVEYFAARPQIQERLTEQISAALEFILDTKDVAVVIKAQHFCVLTRGVKDPDSYTVTSKMKGIFMSDPIARSEFMSLTR